MLDFILFNQGNFQGIVENSEFGSTQNYLSER